MPYAWLYTDATVDALANSPFQVFSLQFTDHKIDLGTSAETRHGEKEQKTHKEKSHESFIAVQYPQRSMYERLNLLSRLYETAKHTASTAQQLSCLSVSSSSSLSSAMHKSSVNRQRVLF